MPRQAKPWFRKEDGWWYLNRMIQGARRQCRLAEGRENRAAAYTRYHEIKAAEAKRKSNPTIIAGEMSVLEIIDRFLKHAEVNVKPSTYAWYKGYLDDFLAAIPDLLLVDELAPHHVTTWLDDNGWRDSNRAGGVCSIRRAFKWAKKERIIPVYPLEGLSAPEKPTRDTLMSEEEFQGVLAKITDPCFRDLLLFTWHTGARPQETVMIDILHLDLPMQRIVIPAKQKPKGKKQGPRVIYLNDIAMEICIRLSAGRESGILLRNAKGKPFTSCANTQRFGRLHRSGKVSKRYCLYHFRHAWATNALTNGLDTTTVGVMMGHKDPGVVAKVYQHLSQNPKFLQAAAQQARQLEQGN